MILNPSPTPQLAILHSQFSIALPSNALFLLYFQNGRAAIGYVAQHFALYFLCAEYMTKTEEKSAFFSGKGFGIMQ